MTQPYAPPRSDGTTVRIVTAVIAALAVVGVVLVLALTDTSAGPAAQGGGLGGGTTADSGAVPGSSGTGGSGGSGGSGAVPSTAELEAKFPFPPGTSRIPTPASEKYGTPGTKYYVTRGTLDSVRTFLVSKLAGLGVKLLRPATDSAGGKIDGYFYNYSSTKLMLDFNLSTDADAGVRAGTVRIGVKFGV